MQQHGLRLPRALRHRNAAQILQPLGQAQVADQIFAALLVHEATARIGPEARDGGLDLGGRHTQREHRRRVWRHAVLPHFATDRDDLRHTGDGQQQGAQHEIRRLPHLHRSHAIAGHSQQHDLAHDGGDGPHLRGDAARQAFTHQGQALSHQLPSTEDVRAPVELDIDDREPDAGDRADAHHAGHAAHRRLDGKGDELLHLLRRQAIGFAEQGDGRAVEVREHIHRHAR